MQLVPTGRPAGDHRAARLRTLIARKRSERRRLERNIDECRIQLAELEALRGRRLVPLDDEVHGHFRFLLDQGRLPRDLEAEVSDLYVELMLTDTLSPRPLPGEQADLPDDDEPCPCPDCQAAGTGPDPADDRVPAPPRHDKGQPGSLRSLYRELATRYHPDKATDEGTRAENERLMREINGAYHAGDLDALAALSQELGFTIAGDDLLETLAAQYEQLKAEIRALRQHPLGQLVIETRRAVKHGQPTPMSQITADTNALADHLEGLAARFRAYRSGELSPEAFFDELLARDDQGQPIDELLAIMNATAGKRRRKRRKGSRR